MDELDIEIRSVMKKKIQEPIGYEQKILNTIEMQKTKIYLKIKVKG